MNLQIPETNGGFAIVLSNDAGEAFEAGLDDVGRYYVDRSKAGPDNWAPGFAKVYRAKRRASGRLVNLRILLDRGSMEIFAEGGRSVMTTTFFPTEDFNRAELRLEAGTKLISGSGWSLNALDQ